MFKRQIYDLLGLNIGCIRVKTKKNMMIWPLLQGLYFVAGAYYAFHPLELLATKYNPINILFMTNILHDQYFT